MLRFQMFFVILINGVCISDTSEEAFSISFVPVPDFCYL